MAQRILEPGEIETLAQRSIPRVRIPTRTTVFARRAARLRHLGISAGIGDYLRFLAVLVDAQHAALKDLSVSVPTPEQIHVLTEHGMPPIQPGSWPSLHFRRQAALGILKVPELVKVSERSSAR